MKRAIVSAGLITALILPMTPARAGVENIGIYGALKHFRHGDGISVYASGYFPRYLCKKRIKFRIKDSAGKKFRMRSLKTEAEGIFTARHGSPYIGDVPAEAALGRARLRGRQRCGVLGKATDTDTIYIVRRGGKPTIVSASSPDVIAGSTTRLRLNIDMQAWTLTYLTVTVEYEAFPDRWVKVDTVTTSDLIVKEDIYRLPWKAKLDRAAPAGRYRFNVTFRDREFEGSVVAQSYAEFFVISSLTGASNPLDGAIDAQDRLVVADTGDDLLAVYSDTGKRVASYGEGELDNPKDLDFGPDGKIYVADYDNKRIAIFSPSGELVDAYGEGLPGEPLTSPFSGRRGPDGIAVDAPRNKIYVADRASGVVFVFPLNADTNDPQEIEPPEFDSPQDVAVAADGSIYVADETAETVFHLSPTGTIIGELNEGIAGPARSVSVAPDGRIYVVAEGTFLGTTFHRVLVYAPDGDLIDSFGAGTLTDTSGVVAAGTAGDVYVMETDLGNIFRFRSP